MIQQLHAHYEADKRSTEQMWERLTQHVTEHTITMQSDERSRGPLNGTHKERIQPMQLEVPSVKRKSSLRLGMIAAVFFTSLIVGSLLLLLQAGHSSQTSSQPPASPACSQYYSGQDGSQLKNTVSSHGLYLSKVGGVEKIDPQTCKSVWHTSIPSTDPRSDVGTPTVIGDTVYVVSDRLFALDTRNGHIRWSHADMSWPFRADGLLYAENGVITPTALLALNPSDGTIKATYQAPAGGWNLPVVANGILYYTTTTGISAMRLSDKVPVWHQPIASNQLLEGLQVKNGIVYTQVLIIGGQWAQSDSIRCQGR